MKRKTRTFGNYLIEKGYISSEQLKEALKIQNKNRLLEDIAVEFQYLTEEQVQGIMTKLEQNNSSFEEETLSTRVLTPNQLKYIYDIRLRRKIRIGKILIENNFITEEKLYEALMMFEVNRKRIHKILICEPSPLIKKFLTHFLTQYKYQLFFAESYEDALELARREKPELFITHYSLWDERNGDILCRDIISTKEVSGIQTIIMANNCDVDTVEELFEYGVHYLLKMPFTEFELLNIIYSVEETKAKTSKEKILVVDDSPITRSMIAKELKNKYNLIMALNGREAIALAEEHKPDLILMDVQMPEMDGFEASGIIRKTPFTTDIPIIIISSLSSTKDRAKGFEVGASEYFNKPFKQGQLYNFINILFEAEHAKREENILIVEDSAIIQHILQHLLKKNGFNVIIANNGNEALKIIKKQSFDLIVCDIEMPVMDGFEFCTAIKADEMLKHIPLIMLSHAGEKDNIIKSLSIGANDYLSKPFDEDELLARINAHITSKKLYDEVYELLQRNKKTENELRKQRNLLNSSSLAYNILQSSENLDETIKDALKIIGEAAEVDRVYIYQKKIDEKSKKVHVEPYSLWINKSTEAKLKDLKPLKFEENEFKDWHRLLSTKKSVTATVANLPEEKRTPLQDQRVVSLIIVPIHIGNTFWGFIGLDDCRVERVWSKAEESILMTSAAGIGSTIERQNNLIKLKENNENLNKLTKKLQEDIDLSVKMRNITMLFLNITEKALFDDALHNALGLLIDYFQMDNAYIFTLTIEEFTISSERSKSKTDFTTDYYYDLDTKKITASYPLYCMDTFIVGDTNILEENFHYLKKRYIKSNVKSLINVASLDTSNVVKGIGLDSRSKKYIWSEEAVDFLRKMVTIINITEEKVLLNEELVKTNKHLEELSIRDGLTNLYNHRHFQDLLKSEMVRSERYEDQELSLILFDIDFFKKFNDTYGHQIGDEVLKTVSRIIQESERSNDISARYGGEEFAFVLPQTGIDGAYEFAERLRKSIEDYEFQIDEKRVHINISLGVTTFAKGKLQEQFIEEADKALYQAKEEGRNRTVVFKA